MTKVHMSQNHVVDGVKRYSSLSLCMNNDSHGRIYQTENPALVTCKKCLEKMKAKPTPIIKPMSRDEFISKVANWLPEAKSLSLGLLKWEALGRVRFERQDGVPVVMVWNPKNKRWVELLRYVEG